MCKYNTKLDLPFDNFFLKDPHSTGAVSNLKHAMYYMNYSTGANLKRESTAVTMLSSRS